MNAIDRTTFGFRHLVVAGTARAKARGAAEVEPIDVVGALLDEPGLDGCALLAFLGVDVAGAAARLAAHPPPEPPAAGPIVGDRPPPGLSRDVKKAVAAAVQLAESSGGKVGTEHLAAALVLAPSPATTVLGAPTLTRRPVLAALREIAVRRKDGAVGYDDVLHAVARARDLWAEGAARTAFELLDQADATLAGSPHRELAATVAVVRVETAIFTDGATFEHVCRQAAPLVAAAAAPGPALDLRVAVANEAQIRGDVEPIRSLLADARAGVGLELGAAVATSADVALRLFDGDGDGATQLVSSLRCRVSAVTFLMDLADAQHLVGHWSEAAGLAGRALAANAQDDRRLDVAETCGRILAHAADPAAGPPLEWAAHVAYANGLSRRWAQAQLGLCVLGSRLQPSPAADQALTQVAAQLEQLGLRPMVIEARLEQARLTGHLGRADLAAWYLDDATARAAALGSRGAAERCDRVRREVQPG